VQNPKIKTTFTTESSKFNRTKSWEN